MHDSDSITTCNTAIPSVANTIKKIYLSSTIFNEYTSTYYDNKYYGYGMLFRNYTSNSVNKINHPDLIKEHKSNMDKADYEYNIQKGVNPPP